MIAWARDWRWHTYTLEGTAGGGVSEGGNLLRGGNTTLHLMSDRPTAATSRNMKNSSDNFVNLRGHVEQFGGCRLGGFAGNERRVISIHDVMQAFWREESRPPRQGWVYLETRNPVAEV